MKIVKELFVAIIVIAIIIITMGITLYNKIPNQKHIEPVEAYKREAEITKILGEETQEEEDRSTLKTYSIDSDEIRNIEGKSVFTKGRSNPFEQLREEPEAKINSQNSSSSTTTINAKTNVSNLPGKSILDNNNSNNSSSNNSTNNKQETGKIFNKSNNDK